MHPLYPVATRLVGKYVYCSHVGGQVHYGILQSVTTTGIYLMPTQGANLSNADSRGSQLDLALHSQDQTDSTLVFFPAAFFAFGALTGLGLGLAAGRRPYYGYGYPYYW